uniref:Uncharacterized protein n=1 Tax=Magallana gigas TaxID=29159 RepID=A0A8W8MLI8_MAGGI
MIKLILLINIILVLNSTLLYIGFAAKGRCDRELYFNGCCPNTQWDSERDMCVDCPSGYYWINCSKPCHYPYYGSKCGQNCSCEEKNCDHMSGCKSGNSIQRKDCWPPDLEFWNWQNLLIAKWLLE